MDDIIAKQIEYTKLESNFVKYAWQPLPRKEVRFELA